MINSKTAAFFVAFTFLTTSSLFSQSEPKLEPESVILYNSQAVKVVLSQEGQIQSFIGVVPDYMTEFAQTSSPVDAVPAEVKEPVVSETTKNAGYAVVSSERLELKYKSNFATLDKSIIDELDVVAAKLKEDPNAKLLLTAFTPDQEKNKLSTNRLNSAITYLGIKGILSYRIQTDVQKSDSLVDVLTVNYLY